MKADWEDKKLIKILKENGVVVMPTDTIYGIVGSALNNTVIERIYEIRKRAPEKPCIILIGGMKDLAKFPIKLSQSQKKEINKFWPGPVSIILECASRAGKKWKALHRETNTLSFRLPEMAGLQKLLQATGPLIAPSANPEGMPPAATIKNAQNYFGDSVDFYVDGGTSTGKASKIIQLHKDGSVSILRA